MAVATNKELALRFYAALSSDDIDSFDEFMAPDLVDRDPLPGQPAGLAGFKAGMLGFRTAFPDLQARAEDVIAEGDRVVARIVVTGTNSGSLFGQPPTGKAVTLSAIDIWRVADGRLAEVWHIEDMLGLLTQLGMAAPLGG